MPLSVSIQETVTALAITGIVAAGAVPMYNQIIEQAAVRNDLHSVYTLNEQLDVYERNGGTPLAETTLDDVLQGMYSVGLIDQKYTDPDGLSAFESGLELIQDGDSIKGMYSAPDDQLSAYLEMIEPQAIGAYLYKD